MAEVTEYKGNKVLVLDPESAYPFQFGVRKAALILCEIGAILDFVQDAEDEEALKGFWKEVKKRQFEDPLGGEDAEEDEGQESCEGDDEDL